MKTLCVITVMVIMVFALTAHGAESLQDIKIIVNKSNSVDQMSDSMLSDIFLKKQTRWNDGLKIKPVDLPYESMVRKNFSIPVLNKTNDQIKSYWMQQIFSGRGIPPIVLDTDSMVIDFVSQNAGAIGYVSKNTSVDSVKEIKIMRQR